VFTYKKIRTDLGPFDFTKGSNPDNVQLEKRPIVMLENGAKYEGEWIVGSDVRHG
jgi:hypothetical protein